MPQASVKVGLEFVGGDASLQRNIARGLAGATGSLRNFDRQLEFANRRVIAFGAAATTLYGSIRAFRELVTATVEVEKALVSMNSIFQLNRRELDTFGKTLFNVARQTSQSFAQVTKAAEEFARQGLNVEETSKRTRDAMILVRLTGIDVARAVNGLTAAMVTFGKTGTDTTRIVNQLVAVDQAFAVSAGGLIDAFTKVGSVVDDAGASFEEFIGLVTAARQITARSESVIGNSLKTILTRLERSSTVAQLEEMGVAVRDIEGNLRPALQVFRAVAASYKDMTRAQQQQVAELGAGVFQINQFKALVQDLGKANGLAARATEMAANATTEAMIRNRVANQTLAASVQNLKTSATEAASVIGNLAIRPIFESFLSGAQGVSDLIVGFGKAGEEGGSAFGHGLLKGIGNFLGTTGIILIGRFFAGALGRIVPEMTRDLLTTGGFTKVRQQEAQQLGIIDNLLKQLTVAEQARFRAASNVAQQEELIVQALQRQVGLRTGAVGGAAAVIGGGRLRGGASRGPRAAEGYIPIAADGLISAMGAERAAIAAGVGGAPSTARPVTVPHFSFGRGQVGPLVANTSEFIVKNYAGGGAAVFNQSMIRKYGLPPGATPVAAKGHVPNAAFGSFMGVPPPPPPRPASDFLSTIPGESSSLRIVAGGGTASASGEGFGQIIKRNAEIEAAAAAQRKINAENEARLLTQRTASAKGDELLLHKELERQAKMKQIADQAYKNTLVQIPGSYGGGALFTKEQAATIEAQGGFLLDARGRPLKQKISDPNSLARGLAESERARFEMEKNIATQAVRDQSRMAALQRTSNRVLMGSFGASIASGFVPQGQAGTMGGQGLGALSGALQGGSMGAFTGSLFGPAGTVPGLIIGALGGAIAGFISRMSTSFDEVSAEIEKANSAFQRKADAVNQAFQIQTQIAEAEASGVGAAGRARLQTQYLGALGGIGNADLMRVVMGGDINRANEMLEDQRRKEGPRNALRLIFSQATGGTGLRGPNVAHQQDAIAAFGQTLAGMDESQLRSTLEGIRDPETALGMVRDFGGGNQTLLETKNRNIEFAQTVVSRAVSEQLALLKLVEQMERARVAAAGPSQVLRREAMGIASGIEMGGARRRLGMESQSRIEQARQQMMLSDPALGPVERLMMERGFGGANISAQFEEQRTGIISGGGANMIRALIGKVTDKGVFRAISGAQNLQSLTNLRGSIFGGQLATGGATDEILDHLGKMIDQLTLIKDAELSALSENETTNTLLQKGLEKREKLDILTAHATQTMSDISMLSNLKAIRIESRGRIRQAEQSMLLNAPGVGPVEQLMMQREFDPENIRSQFEVSRIKALASARTGLLGLINPNDPRLVGTRQAIEGAKGLGGFTDLLDRSAAGKLPAGENTTALFQQLVQVVSQLVELNATEKVALTENDKTNKILQEQLRRDRTLEGVRANLELGLREGRRSELLQSQSVLDLAGRRDLGITGSQVEAAMMTLALDAGQQGKMKGSFFAGLSAPLDRLKQDLTQFAQVGQAVAISLEQNLGNAFGNFIVGAQSGKDAFRSFAASVTQDAARAFASKGVQMLVGLLASAFLGSGAPANAALDLSLTGKPEFLKGAGPTFGLASGGRVPSLVTGGEFIFSPSQASKIGPARLNALNRFNNGGPAGLVRGGSGFMDDVFLRLATGAFVINKNSTDKIGAGNLAALAGATTTMTTSPVDQMASAMFTSGATTPVPISSASGGGNVNVTVGVTINDNSSSTTSRTGGDGAPKDRQFGEGLGKAIEQLVLQKIAEQTRVGGMLRRQSLAFT